MFARIVYPNQQSSAGTGKKNPHLWFLSNDTACIRSAVSIAYLALALVRNKQDHSACIKEDCEPECLDVMHGRGARGGRGLLSSGQDEIFMKGRLIQGRIRFK